MEVTRHDDAAAFLEVVEPHLLRDESRHNLALGLLGVMVEHPEVYPRRHLWLVEDGGTPVGAALMTPPHNLVLTAPAMDGALDALARALVEDGVDVPGVVGGLPEVDDLVTAYAEPAGRVVSSRMEQGIFALERVEPAEAPAGASRPAEPADADLAFEWIRTFVREADPESPWDEERARRRLDFRLEGGDETRSGLWLWDDGGPVSLVGYGNPTPSGIRIGPVYTPPESRRRGYATGLVAAVSEELLAQGRRFCFLYTDLANPTSNAIYRRIGYRLVCGSAQVTFGPAGAAEGQSRL